MMKYVHIFILILFVPLFATAQDSDFYQDDFPESNYEYEYNKSPLKKSKLPLLNESNFNFRLTTGTSYTNFYGNNIFSSYVMPEMRYKLTNKLTISGGVIANLNYFPNFSLPNQETAMFNTNKSYSYYLFAKGEYVVNDRLRIRGMGIYSPGSDMFNDNFSYGSIGFDVRVAEKAFISAEVSISKSNYNYPSINNPFGGYFDNFHTRPLGNTLSAGHFSQW